MNEPNVTIATTDNSKLCQTIREIYNRTVAPVQCTNQQEFTELGFTFNKTPYAIGYYSQFHRADRKGESIILKTLDLSQLKPACKRQRLQESCKILDYLSKQENVPNVARLFGQFIIDDHLFLFMRYYQERSIHYKMRVVPHFKESLIERWYHQLGSVCQHIQTQGIIHRSIRVEHLLLDDQDNIQLTGWTRAIFMLHPITLLLNKCNREFRCRKRNHLPPECFIGTSHSPALIDVWSFGTMVASLYTNRHPFEPRRMGDINHEMQWQAFSTKHGHMIANDWLPILRKLFVMLENDRISLNSILNSNFFMGNKAKEDGTKVNVATTGKQPAPKFTAIPLRTINKVKHVSKVQPTGGKHANVSVKKSGVGDNSTKMKSQKRETKSLKSTKTNKSVKQEINKLNPTKNSGLSSTNKKLNGQADESGKSNTLKGSNDSSGPHFSVVKSSKQT
ncbi:hypothetical protein RDWZM_001388 [Blomia tropicalis]|uniref:Protein kinase domain-containing protein n=1 Tax=Blomia tropicalis TaxID=40697 RepID=A0A9Q0MAJ8_BLOTA|nr:hypothetical protein RDWZM_001388 [Blomia tropicalis]